MHRNLRLLLTTLTLAVLAAVVAGRAVSADSAPKAFRTPSGNIYCFNHTAGAIRCDILSGYIPRPPRRLLSPWCFDPNNGEPPNTVTLARGPANVGCATDSVAFSFAKTLPYGRTWRRGGITCASRPTGLRCVNTAGHGFFLSRERSYVIRP